MKQFYEPFRFKANTKVNEIEEAGKHLLVTFDNTIFYPGGGGQPCDTGTILAKGFKGRVVEAFKQEENIIHKVEPLTGSLSQGDEVTLAIDEERRRQLVRMHTGEHILFKSLETVLGSVKLLKIKLGEEESSLFITARALDWEVLFEAEKLANQIISEDRPLIKKIYTKEQAVRLGKLRIKPERISSEKVRVVEVRDFDWSACTGTHAPSTGYVENLVITGFNQAKGAWEISFKVKAQESLFSLARTAREAAFLLQTGSLQVIPLLQTIQQEAASYKQKYREVSSKLLEHYQEEKINDLTFIWNILDNVEKKQLIDKANGLAKKKALVCFISRHDDRAVVILQASPDLSLDAPNLLQQALGLFHGKGGGRGSFAMGSLPAEHSEEAIESLKKGIRKNRHGI